MSTVTGLLTGRHTLAHRKDILRSLAPEICHQLQALEPALDESAWSGLLSLFQYNEMGRNFVRNFGFQAATAMMYKRWNNPSEVARRHVHEKWQILRAIVEHQAHEAAGWQQVAQSW